MVKYIKEIYELLEKKDRKFLPLKYYRYRFEQPLRNRQYTWYNGRMVQEEGGCKEVARRLQGGCSVIFIEGIRYGIAGAAQAP